jgi:hypothetical protein
MINTMYPWVALQLEVRVWPRVKMLDEALLIQKVNGDSDSRNGSSFFRKYFR